MFTKASRLKLRFDCARGSISAEDLWDLPVQELDAIFRKLNAQAKEQSEESLLEGSLLEEKSGADTALDLKIEIIKHIVKTKLEERERREKAAERRVKKQKLLGYLEEKEDAGLKELSPSKLKKMIEDLGD